MQKVDVEFEDDFVCVNGVDVVRLLKATRATLLEAVMLSNANVLVNERCVNIWHSFFYLSTNLYQVEMHNMWSQESSGSNFQSSR